MSKNNILLLSFVLGCFCLFQISIFSKTSQASNKSLMPSNAIYSKNSIDADVYICKGPESKRYHYTKSCRGLNSCSTKLYKVSLSKAKELKRTLCGWED